MPTFYYQALDAEGQTVAGQLEADSVHDALAQLDTEGLAVQSIGLTPFEPASRPIPEPSPSPSGERGTTEPAGEVERAVLRSHLASVLDEARAIAPALRAYAEEMPAGHRRSELRTICRVLDGGDADEATRALESLPEYWIPLLSSATTSGDPGRVLQGFLAESHRADELRRQRWAILAYPAAIALIAAGVFIAISFFIIPDFADIFLDFGLELPELTLAVIGLARWINSGGALVALAVIAVIGLLWTLLRRRRPAAIPTVRFGWPFGRSTAIARFAHFTADLIEAGLETPSALRIAGFTTRKPRLRRAAWRLAGNLEQGATALDPSHRPLTSTVLYALRTEMPTSSRVHLLREIGQCHAGRARSRLSWTYGIVEPVAIGAIGLAVAAVVLALFLPLVTLVNGLSG